jgi:hypothetical protein
VLANDVSTTYTALFPTEIRVSGNHLRAQSHPGHLQPKPLSLKERLSVFKKHKTKPNEQAAYIHKCGDQISVHFKASFFVK